MSGVNCEIMSGDAMMRSSERGQNARVQLRLEEGQSKLDVGNPRQYGIGDPNL